MRQCPDCEEKDRVVIAGKVFCANCGTPWQPVDPSEEATYKQKIGMDAAAPAPASAPAAANPPAPTPAAAPVAAPTPAPSTPAVSPNPSTPPAPATAQVSVAPSAPAPVVSTPAPTPATTTAPNPVPSPEPKPLAELQSQIGSEIPSLDSKDESVLSDSQIREMGSVKPQVAVPQTDPAPVSSPLPAAPQSTPSQPSVAPQPAPTPTPTSAPAPTPPSSPQPAPAAPQVNRVLNDVVAPQPTSSPSNVASPAPVVASDTNTTVAGVTMSREDALKLALGEDAVPEAATKTGPARPTAVVMTVIGLALLGVFLWQVNASDIQVKLASLRAGLTASVPGFVPGGWSGAQSLKASEGGVSYELVKDGKTLKIEQQKSDWDSQAVLEQYVLRRSTDYLALQSQGLTIYMFGDNQAAWVNQGAFYTLSGDHGIEQDDIIRMATSL